MKSWLLFTTTLVVVTGLAICAHSQDPPADPFGVKGEVTATDLLFGDGSDGDATVITSTYNLYRDYNFQNLTVNSGATIETHGYIIRVAGTLLNNGTITDSNTGQAGGAGGAGGPGGYLALLDIYMPGAGAPGTIRGGGGGGGFAHTWDYLYYVWSGNGGNGGIGGKNGGTVVIYAKVLDNGNVIHANGFNGGSGAGGWDGRYLEYGVWPIYGDMAAGGGGGGDGGTVEIYYGSCQSYGTVTATGGNGGAGGLGGDGLDTHHSDLGCIKYDGAFGYGGGGDGGDAEISTDASEPGG